MEGQREGENGTQTQRTRPGQELAAEQLDYGACGGRGHGWDRLGAAALRLKSSEDSVLATHTHVLVSKTALQHFVFF